MAVTWEVQHQEPWGCLEEREGTESPADFRKEIHCLTRPAAPRRLFAGITHHFSRMETPRVDELSGGGGVCVRGRRVLAPLMTSVRSRPRPSASPSVRQRIRPTPSPGACRSVQSLSRVRLFAAPRPAAHQASLPFTVSWSLLKPMSIELMRPSSHLILCHPLLPSIFPSIGVFSNESALHFRWPKYWSFSFSISSSHEYSGLISFTIDWFDLAVQGTLKSLFQHQNSKVSVLQCSAFFMV